MVRPPPCEGCRQDRHLSVLEVACSLCVGSPLPAASWLWLWLSYSGSHHLHKATQEGRHVVGTRHQLTVLPPPGAARDRDATGRVARRTRGRQPTKSDGPGSGHRLGAPACRQVRPQRSALPACYPQPRCWHFAERCWQGPATVGCAHAAWAGGAVLPPGRTASGGSAAAPTARKRLWRRRRRGRGRRPRRQRRRRSSRGSLAAGRPSVRRPVGAAGSGGGRSQRHPGHSRWRGDGSGVRRRTQARQTTRRSPKPLLYTSLLEAAPSQGRAC